MTIADDLERLSALHRSGTLSDAEFASAKARALDGDASRGDAGSVGSWLRSLRRSRADRWLGGVCGGLAPATGLPAWMWRLVFVAFVVCAGSGVLLYVLLWLLLPLEDGIVDLASGPARSAG